MFSNEIFELRIQAQQQQNNNNAGGDNAYAAADIYKWIEIFPKNMHEKDQVPAGRSGHAATIIRSETGEEDEMLVFGGRVNDDLRCNETFIFNFKTRMWRRLVTHGTIPTIRSSHQVCQNGHYIITFSGIRVNRHDSVDVNNGFDCFALNLLNNNWQRIEIVNFPQYQIMHKIWGYSLESIIGEDKKAHILFFGGTDEQVSHNDLHDITLQPSIPPYSVPCNTLMESLLPCLKSAKCNVKVFNGSLYLGDANSTVLCQSPVFAKMLCEQDKLVRQEQCYILNIEQISPMITSQVFQQVVAYLNGKEPILSIDTLIDFLAVSAHLKLAHFAAYCEHMAQQVMSCKFVLKLLNTAHKNGFTNLVDKCMDFIKKNINELKQLNVCLQSEIPVDLLEKLFWHCAAPNTKPKTLQLQQQQLVDANSQSPIIWPDSYYFTCPYILTSFDPIISLHSHTIHLRKTSLLSDIEVKTADGGSFHLHKLILCCRIAYFSTLFNSGMLEAQSNVLELPEDLYVEKDALSILFDWVYGVPLNNCESIDDALLFKVAFAAKTLNLHDNYFEDLLINRISHENAEEFLQHAKFTNLEKLANHCKTLVVEKKGTLYFFKFFTRFLFMIV